MIQHITSFWFGLNVTRRKPLSSWVAFFSVVHGIEAAVME
jgi:hypothetical protein